MRSSFDDKSDAVIAYTVCKVYTLNSYVRPAGDRKQCSSQSISTEQYHISIVVLNSNITTKCASGSIHIHLFDIGTSHDIYNASSYCIVTGVLYGFPRGRDRLSLSSGASIISC